MQENEVKCRKPDLEAEDTGVRKNVAKRCTATECNEAQKTSDCEIVKTKRKRGKRGTMQCKHQKESAERHEIKQNEECTESVPGRVPRETRKRVERRGEIPTLYRQRDGVQRKTACREENAEEVQSGEKRLNGNGEAAVRI